MNFARNASKFIANVKRYHLGLSNGYAARRRIFEIFYFLFIIKALDDPVLG